MTSSAPKVCQSVRALRKSCFNSSALVTVLTLTGAAVITVGAASAVLAGGGAGGTGAFAAGGSGGGSGQAGQGVNSGSGGAAGAAGGGNATIGSTGGTGGNGIGTAVGAGGGGGGGSGLTGAVGSPVNGNVAGGNGGLGGTAQAGALSVGGGGGGEGGIGISNLSQSLTVSPAVTVSGGIGGNGGDGAPGSSTGGNGGNGGDGGIGITATGVSINNNGTIAGGNGGAGSINGGTNGGSGSGAVAISGSNLTVINSGTISGGLDGTLALRSDAIRFTGGVNTLQLQQGFTITGNVVGVNGGTDTLQLGGATNSAFGLALIGTQYLNFKTLEKVGSNTWTLTGSPGAAIDLKASAGTLDLSNNATFSSFQLNNGAAVGGAGTLTTAGAIDLQSGTVSAILAGTGAATKTTGGTVTLSGANTYSGGTTISAGTLQVTNSTPGTSSSVGAGAVTMDGGTFRTVIDNLVFSNAFRLNATGGTFDTNNNLNLTLSGAVSNGTGGGTLTKTGEGVLTLTGALSYTGLTTVTGGTANNTSSLVLGDAQKSVTLPGNLVIGNSFSNLAVSNGSLGAGTIDNSVGGGIVVGFLAGSSASAGSSTIINAGNLSFQNTGTAGTSQITNNPGVVDFADTSTAAGSTITSSNGGQLQFRNNSTAASATIVTNAGSTTTFANAASGGTSRQIVNTGGVLDISSTNAGTTIGSLEGAGSVGLGDRTLTIGGNNQSTTFSGVIQDAALSGFTGGAIVKSALGTLTLSGANTYTGTTTVSAGILSVNGSIASSVLTTVNAGGTIGGTGTTGNLTINGGTLAPGNSIGTLNVNGNLVLTAASAYMVEVSPAASDRVNVTGTATLGGTVNASFATGGYMAKRYTIVSATGGVNPGFSGLTSTNRPANVTTALAYDANNAYLDLTLAFAPQTGLNVNRTNVANALVNSFNTAGGIPMAFASLTAAGLTQVSGELGTGTQQATYNAMDLLLGLMTDPFVAGRDQGFGGSGSATGYADEALAHAGRRKPNDAYAAINRKAPRGGEAAAQRWSVWSAGFGGSQTTDGNAALGSNAATSRVYGGAVGLDYRVSPSTLMGVTLAGGGTNFSVANSGTGRSDLFQAGAFLRHTMGANYLSAALAYGWQDVTTDRSVGADRLTGRFTSNAFSGRFEGGHRVIDPTFGVGFTPYAAAQFTTLDLPGYGETPAATNTFGLTYAAKTVTAARSELGVRTDKSYAMSDGVLTLRGRAAWAHNFDPDRSIGATFQTLPAASFVVNGAAQAREAALLTASAEMKWLNGWAAAATFEGEFSNVTRSYAGKGVVRYAW